MKTELRNIWGGSLIRPYRKAGYGRRRFRKDRIEIFIYYRVTDTIS